MFLDLFVELVYHNSFTIFCWDIYFYKLEFVFFIKSFKVISIILSEISRYSATNPYFLWNIKWPAFSLTISFPPLLTSLNSYMSHLISCSSSSATLTSRECRQIVSAWYQFYRYMLTAKFNSFLHWPILWIQC